jgi:hypothetical protein
MPTIPIVTLLTAFLGHHTEWLDVLGPDAYKRHHMQQIEARGNPEDSAIPRRTVITTTDRITARRLIYLLSAFLPAKATRHWNPCRHVQDCHPGRTATRRR